MRRPWIVLFLCGLVLNGEAQNPNRPGMPFQGHLAQAQEGHPERYEPLPDGTYSLTLSLYTSPTGSESRVWGPERHEQALVVNGSVNVLIGSSKPLPLEPGFFEKPLYVGWSVDRDGHPETAESELAPRQLLSTPLYATLTQQAFYAQQSEYARQADQAVHAQNALNSQIAETALSAQNGCPPGTVIAYAGMTVPEGWLPCDGQAVSRQEYSDLFEAIGTAWGYGDQKQTFNIPDLRGYFLRGWAKGRITDPDKDSRRNDKPGQSKGDLVGSVQDSAFEQHRHRFHINAQHPFNVGVEIPTLIHSTHPTEDGLFAQNDSKAAEVLDPSTGNASRETRPLNVYVHYLIKY